jgi:hypothetical protein
MTSDGDSKIGMSFVQNLASDQQFGLCSVDFIAGQYFIISLSKTIWSFRLEFSLNFWRLDMLKTV